jgi:hypothetical protein
MSAMSISRLLQASNAPWPIVSLVANNATIPKMTVYSRIFAATSKRFSSAASSGRKYPPQLLWGLPGFVGATWFIWGALTEDIKQSVGLYWDPDVVIKRVDAERIQRIEAKEAAKAVGKPAEPEEEDEEEEEEVTAKDIEAAVNAAVEQAGDADEDEEEEEEKKEDDEEEEEEEAPKPKKKKVNPDELSAEEKWDYFAERAVVPGDDVSTKIWIHPIVVGYSNVELQSYLKIQYLYISSRMMMTTTTTTMTTMMMMSKLLSLVLRILVSANRSLKKSYL